LEAVYPTARDRLNFIELERDEGLTPHKVKHVYICGTTSSTVKIDVSDYLETNTGAARAQSQIADMARWLNASAITVMSSRRPTMHDM
jgi:hypothetical protein